MRARPFLAALVVGCVGLSALLAAGGSQASPASPALTCCWSQPWPSWTATDPTPTPTVIPPTPTPGTPGTPRRPTDGGTPGMPGVGGTPTGPATTGAKAAGTDWHAWWMPARLKFWPAHQHAAARTADAPSDDAPEAGAWRTQLAVLAERGIWTERGSLAEGLVYLHDPALLDLSFALVADPVIQVSRLGVFAAASQMGTGPSAVTALARVLDDPSIDPFARGAAAASLGAVGDPSAAPVLWTRVRGRAERLVRAGALIGLGGVAGPEAVPELARVVADRREDTPVRTAAVVALGWCAQREGGARAAASAALADLAANAKGLDVEVRQTVALNLGHADPSALTTRRAAALLADDADGRTRAMAAIALGRLARRVPDVAEPARRALAVAWDAEAPEVRAFVALGLGLARATAERRRLEGWLAGKGDPLHRGAAAIALGLLDDPAAAPALLAATAEGPPGLRADAAEALALAGGAVAVERLRALLADDSSAVRAAAAYALGFLGQARDLEAIAPLLRSANAMDRQGAVLGLGAFGGARARDLLLAALADESNPAVRSLGLFAAVLAVAPRPLAAPAKDVDRSPWARDH